MANNSKHCLMLHDTLGVVASVYTYKLQGSGSYTVVKEQSRRFGLTSDNHPQNKTSCDLYLFSGYRVFKFTLFLAGFAAGFFFTYLLCSGYLVDHLPEKALEHKDQVQHNFGCCRTVSCLTPGRHWPASLAGFSESGVLSWRRSRHAKRADPLTCIHSSRSPAAKTAQHSHANPASCAG